jgi:cysteine desulfurase
MVNFIEGGAQERGKRGGTENVPAIAGMAAALAEAYQHLDENNAKTALLRDKLIQAFTAIPRSRLNGHREQRLPGNANFCFEGVEGESLLLQLDLAGISASSGSACTSGSLDPSHVLLALGLPHEIAHGSLRLSLSEYNTPEEIDHIIAVLPPIIQRLRDMSPLWERIVKGA